MLQSKQKGMEMIEEYNSYKKNVYTALETLSIDTFEVFNDNKCIIIKNIILSYSHELQGLNNMYRHRNRSNPPAYEDLILKKFYFCVEKINLILNNLENNADFNICFYDESIKDGATVYIIKQNVAFTLHYCNYINITCNISKDCVWYVLSRILFFMQ